MKPHIHFNGAQLVKCNSILFNGDGAFIRRLRRQAVGDRWMHVNHTDALRLMRIAGMEPKHGRYGDRNYVVSWTTSEVNRLCGGAEASLLRLVIRNLT